MSSNYSEYTHSTSATGCSSVRIAPLRQKEPEPNQSSDKFAVGEKKNDVSSYQ